MNTCAHLHKYTHTLTCTSNIRHSINATTNIHTVCLIPWSDFKPEVILEITKSLNHACMCIWMCLYVLYICVHVCECHPHVRECMYKVALQFTKILCVRMHACVCMYVYPYVFMNIYVCADVCIYALCMYVYMYGLSIQDSESMWITLCMTAAPCSVEK